MWHNNKRRKRLASAAADQTTAAPGPAPAPRVTRNSVAAPASDSAAQDPYTTTKAVLAAASGDDNWHKGSSEACSPDVIPQNLINARAAQKSPPSPQVLVCHRVAISCTMKLTHAFSQRLSVPETLCASLLHHMSVARMSVLQCSEPVVRKLL